MTCVLLVHLAMGQLGLRDEGIQFDKKQSEGKATKRRTNSAAAPAEIRLIPLRLDGEIRPGDSLVESCSLRSGDDECDSVAGDILVVKHKIVSKAEGCLVDLSTIQPSVESIAWAKQYDLDARVIELALRESRAVIRRKNGVLITETRHGFLCANSGIDVSNVDGGSRALLLPEDPDRSAADLQRAIKKQTGISYPSSSPTVSAGRGARGLPNSPLGSQE